MKAGLKDPPVLSMEITLAGQQPFSQKEPEPGCSGKGLSIAPSRDYGNLYEIPMVSYQHVFDVIGVVE
jgi:hypothetical protein